MQKENVFTIKNILNKLLTNVRQKSYGAKLFNQPNFTQF